MAEKKIDPIRPTDDDAREMARLLVAEAHFGALAVNEPDTGMPLVSRIAIGTDRRGAVISLASDLSFHSQALAIDARASILIGEPGKGDPLAHPRITLIGRMEVLDNAAPERAELRETWLEQHPKAQLYIDFGDFRFYRLKLERAHLNGGFGKAYVLKPADFATA
ncbi:MAG: pyridoxamine 5-phosphate oxidase [Pseudomonadota bacterium]|nr:pyridoxamine 5-phosphate oxidase [Pseudomonadota bacterium]